MHLISRKRLFRDLWTLAAIRLTTALSVCLSPTSADEPADVALDASTMAVSEAAPTEAPARTDWTYQGKLKSVARTTNRFPLSDQENNHGWNLVTEFSDEFNGGHLDDNKWWDHNPHWYGRAPGRFLAENVEVQDGELRITMRKDGSLSPERFYSHDYHTWSSGSVCSKEVIRYGYFEVEAAAMKSAGSSAWWFTGSAREKRTGQRWRTEIDVFELGGRAVGKEHDYHMNLHVFERPGSKRHEAFPAVFETPFAVADEPHVYGLEWTPTRIKYFIDGVMVRDIANRYWHIPLRMLFDSETMFDWLGEPEPDHLPSTFRVRYVRTWKNRETSLEWREQYEPAERERSDITNYVRKMQEMRSKPTAEEH